MRPKPYFAPPFRPHLARECARSRTIEIIAHRQVRNYTCGYASALTVLRHFRPAIEARALFERLGTDRGGTRQAAIIRELRRAGLGANARYDFDFARLRTAVDRGKLVIAYYYPAEHWVVLYGYGVLPARVFVADSRAGERCEHSWDEYGPTLRGFGIVVSDRQMRPRSEPAGEPPRRVLITPPPAPREQRAAEPERAEQLAFDF